MNIFVGCSSRDVTDNVKWSRYCTATLEVTKFITAHKHTLVFGGCARGLMGLMYKCILLNKANIIVAIPQAYINDAEELFYSNLFDFNTVSERKDWIFKNTSMHIFLPGGIGTIDELFSSIEAKRCGEHNSPSLSSTSKVTLMTFYTFLHEFMMKALQMKKTPNCIPW